VRRGGTPPSWLPDRPRTFPPSRRIRSTVPSALSWADAPHRTLLFVRARLRHPATGGRPAHSTACLEARVSIAVDAGRQRLVRTWRATSDSRGGLQQAACSGESGGSANAGQRLVTSASVVLVSGQAGATATSMFVVIPPPRTCSGQRSRAGSLTARPMRGPTSRAATASGYQAAPFTSDSWMRPTSASAVVKA
jgi:hypothetical protein